MNEGLGVYGIAYPLELARWRNCAELGGLQESLKRLCFSAARSGRPSLHGVRGHHRAQDIGDDSTKPWGFNFGTGLKPERGPFACSKRDLAG